MEGSSESPSSRPPSPDARPRRPFGLFVAVVVLVLIGRGFGLFGHDAADSGGPAGQAPERPRFLDGERGSEPQRTEVAASRETNAAANEARERAVRPADTPATIAPPPAPIAEAPSSPPTPHEAADGVDSDRFASLLSLVRVRCSEDRFGEALVAVDHARSLPLDRDQRSALEEAKIAANDALRTALQRAVALVRDGAVLEARRMLTTMLAEADGGVRAEVSTALLLAGSEPDRPLDRPADPQAAPPPTARLLPRDRRVRTRWNGVDVVARVADSRSDEVTLRIEEGQGVTFPTVPVVGCDLVEPTAAEAVEMGFAALHAGDALLARLWLSCVSLRGARDGERAKRLAEVLR